MVGAGEMIQGFPAGIAGMLLLAACAAPANFDASFARFEQALAACTAQFGYDPETVGDIGDYQLGENERPWLECAYAGVETHLVPYSAVPELYTDLIAEHRALTDGVERGEVTRAAREDRVDTVLASIERQERAFEQSQIKRLDDLRDQQERQRQLREIDRIQREFSIMRRSVGAKL